MAGKEQKSFQGHLLIKDVLLEGGNSHFFTASLEIQFLISPGDFGLDIINNFAISKLCSLHAPVVLTIS